MSSDTEPFKFYVWISNANLAGEKIKLSLRR